MNYSKFFHSFFMINYILFSDKEHVCLKDIHLKRNVFKTLTKGIFKTSFISHSDYQKGIFRTFF